MKFAIYSPYPQSGKSTVGNILESYGLTRLSLATPVKESLLVVLTALGTKNPESYLWGENKDKIIPELNVTGGYLMSTYATNFFRDTIYTNIWLDCFKRKVDGLDNWFVDDMRFENEYKYLKSQGVITILLERPKVGLNGRSSRSEGNLSHLPFDVKILNDSDIETLEKKVEKMFHFFKRV